MKHNTLQNETAEQVMAHDPNAVRDVLRSYRIAPSSRMSLAAAADATSTSTDELLAVIETRMRRAAQHQHEEEHDARYELI